MDLVVSIVGSFFGWIGKIHRYPKSNKGGITIFWMILSMLVFRWFPGVIYENFLVVDGVIILTNTFIALYSISVVFTKFTGIEKGAFRAIYRRISEKMVIVVWAVSVFHVHYSLQSAAIMSTYGATLGSLKNVMLLLITCVGFFTVVLPKPLPHLKQLRDQYTKEREREVEESRLHKKKEEERLAEEKERLRVEENRRYEAETAYKVDFEQRFSRYLSELYGGNETKVRVELLLSGVLTTNQFMNDKVDESIELTNTEFNEHALLIKRYVQVLWNFWDTHRDHMLATIEHMDIAGRGRVNKISKGISKYPEKTSMMRYIRNRLKGYYGEQNLNKKLTSSGVDFVDGLTYQSKITGRTVELDAMIICDDSLHVFEVKDYSAKKIVLEKSGYFYKVGYNDEEQKMETFSQVERCNNVLRDILGKDIPIYNYIILSDAETRVVNHFDSDQLKVIHVDAVPFVLSGIKQTGTTDVYKRIKRQMSEAITEERSYAAVDVVEARNRLEAEMSAMREQMGHLKTYSEQVVKTYIDGIYGEMLDKCAEDIADEVVSPNVSDKFIERVKYEYLITLKDQADFFERVLLNDDTGGGLYKMNADLQLNRA